MFKIHYLILDGDMAEKPANFASCQLFTNKYKIYSCGLTLSSEPIKRLHVPDNMAHNGVWLNAMYALSLLVLYSSEGDFCPDALVFRSQQGTLNCDMN